MGCEHEPITDKGETYCKLCGEVLGYEIIPSITRAKSRERYRGNYMF